MTSLTKFFCDPGTALLASFLLGCWALVQLTIVTYVSDNSTCDRVDMNPMKRKKPQKRLTGRRALSKPPRPFPAWAPVHLSPAAKERLLQAADRQAVREAERRVEDAWFSHRKASENRPLDEKRRELTQRWRQRVPPPAKTFAPACGSRRRRKPGRRLTCPRTSPGCPN